MKESIVIKIPYPAGVLALAVLFFWLGYSLFLPFVSWYTAIIDKNTIVLQAEAQAEANRILSEFK